MSTQFKPIETADIPTVIAMMEEFYAIDNYPIDVDKSKGLMRQFIENEGLGRGWLVLQDGVVSGYAILTFVFSFEYGGRIAFLDELFFLPNARGHGLGKHTLDFIEEQAKQLSVQLIYLEVENHNTVAQQLYLSKKYTIHTRGMMKLVIE